MYLCIYKINEDYPNEDKQNNLFRDHGVTVTCRVEQRQRQAMAAKLPSRKRRLTYYFLEAAVLEHGERPLKRGSPGLFRDTFHILQLVRSWKWEQNWRSFSLRPDQEDDCSRSYCWWPGLSLEIATQASHTSDLQQGCLTGLFVVTEGLASWAGSRTLWVMVLLLYIWSSCSASAQSVFFSLHACLLLPDMQQEKKGNIKGHVRWDGFVTVRETCPGLL